MLQRRLFLLAALISLALISFGLLNAASPAAVSYLPIIAADAPLPYPAINNEELVMSSLQSRAANIWTIEVSSSDYLTITTAPAASANMIISVLDPNGKNIVDKQDEAPAGEVETVANLSVTEPGRYQIHIAADPAIPTDFAMMVMDSSSYNFVFRGTLSPGIQRADYNPVDTDVYWFFPAVDGETLGIEVTPTDLADAYVELYGPDGDRLLTLDKAGKGDAEILEDYTIVESGMYAIRVGEFDFEEMSYQIILNK